MSSDTELATASAPSPDNQPADRAVVLRLIMAGASDKEIADYLFIARRTASEHVSNILAILGQSSRTGAASYAAANGLRAWPTVPPDPESSG